jgi:hypothetical protein
MKRRVAVLLALTSLLVGLAAPAQALPGIDPPSAANRFEIFLRDLQAHEMFERLAFQRSDGWDFGDRTGYACAWVEYQTGGRIQFRIDFQLVVGSEYQAGSLQINDRNGLEGRDGAVPCGSTSSRTNNLQADGSAFVPNSGVTFTVASNGSVLTTYTLPAVSATSNESFWSPGNDPGEAYLWRAEPGETPTPVLRATVTPVATGVTLAATTSAVVAAAAPLESAAEVPLTPSVPTLVPLPAPLPAAVPLPAPTPFPAAVPFPAPMPTESPLAPA